MSRVVRIADMLRGRDWTAKQAAIIECLTRYLAVIGGRRFGKSYTCAPAFLKRVHRRHEILIECLRQGKPSPWSASTMPVQKWAGAGMPKAYARQQPPSVNAVVIAPMERHLEQCKRYIHSYYGGSFSKFVHPDLAYAEAGRQMWLFYGGIATCIKFVVGKSITSVVSDENDIIWIDEAGMLDDRVYDALAPTTWNRDGEVLCSGTPEKGVEHWFNRMCLQGMSPEHEYYEPNVVDADETVTTIVGTSYEAYDPAVREAAKRAAKLLGPGYEAQWIKGDWRLPGQFVYDNWDASVHVVDYDSSTRQLAGFKKPLPPPNLILGVIDFSYSPTQPGAAVVYHIWYKHPLDRHLGKADFRRPLVIAVEDLEQCAEYDATGWFKDLSKMRFRHGVRYWRADPSRDEMLKVCRRFKSRAPAIGGVKPAEKKDKAGRRNLLKALLQYDEQSIPGFLVSSQCEVLPVEFASYKWLLDAKGDPKPEPQTHDDHALDCCTFLMPHVWKGGIALPGAGAM
ncbi:MAG: hypothetical protein ACYTBJ_02430 [Planctomycetota bacterium]|jgi:hypothetical protein